MEVFNKIISLLDNNKITYVITQHKPVRTSEEAAKIRGVELKTGAKAMIVKSKDGYCLLVLPADRKIDWKKVKQMLNVKEIRFATEAEAEHVAKVQMGSVPPLGNILGLPTYFDEKILENECVNFNPGSRSHSISMKSIDLVKLVQPNIESIVAFEPSL